MPIEAVGPGDRAPRGSTSTERPRSALTSAGAIAYSSASPRGRGRGRPAGRSDRRADASARRGYRPGDPEDVRLDRLRGGDDRGSRCDDGCTGDEEGQPPLVGKRERQQRPGRNEGDRICRVGGRVMDERRGERCADGGEERKRREQGRSQLRHHDPGGRGEEQRHQRVLADAEAAGGERGHEDPARPQERVRPRKAPSAMTTSAAKKIGVCESSSRTNPSLKYAKQVSATITDEPERTSPNGTPEPRRASVPSVRRRARARDELRWARGPGLHPLAVRSDEVRAQADQAPRSPTCCMLRSRARSSRRRARRRPRSPHGARTKPCGRDQREHEAEKPVVCLHQQLEGGEKAARCRNGEPGRRRRGQHPGRTREDDQNRNVGQGQRSERARQRPPRSQPASLTSAGRPAARRAPAQCSRPARTPPRRCAVHAVTSEGNVRKPSGPVGEDDVGVRPEAVGGGEMQSDREVRAPRSARGRRSARSAP